MFTRTGLRTCAASAAAATAATLAAARDGGSALGSRKKAQQFTQPGLEGLRIAAYVESVKAEDVDRGLANQAIAIGSVVAQLSESVFAVDFRESNLTPLIEVGSRVHVAYERTDEKSGFLMGGLVVKVNPNGTFGVLLDNNRLDLAVPREKIAICEGRCKFLNDPKYASVVDWVRSAGLQSADDIQSSACILYHRGWRYHRLYLLEAGDVQQMAHLSKSSRMCLMEKAEWQRDHHRQMRSIYKERVKERDKRYLFAKYAGILSASVAFCGAFSLFGWNYKNYLKQQRSYQMRFAVKTLTTKASQRSTVVARDQEKIEVPRETQERWVRQIFRQLDTAHPRIVVLTGSFGCGKSSLCRAAIEKEELNAVFVDVRNKEDVLRSVIKALGVPSVESCGDPLDFIADACKESKQLLRGKTPVLVLKLREGDNLTRVYNEAVTLACDRRVCHLVIEVPMESLTMANTSLPRLDFYTVPNFSRDQAFKYTQNAMNPLDMEYFMDTVGTNSNDLDEIFAAVHQRRISPNEYTNQKLLKAMRHLQAVWAGNDAVKAAVKCLAKFPYAEGQHEGVDEVSLRDPALKDLVLYNPVQDVWIFTNKVFHTAARCCM